MRTAVIFSDGVKQVVLTPETDDEKYALSLIQHDSEIEVLVKSGSFGGTLGGVNEPSTYGVNIGMCQGGFLRVWGDDESKIFVIKPRKKNDKNGNA